MGVVFKCLEAGLEGRVWVNGIRPTGAPNVGFGAMQAVPLISSSRWLVKRGELVKVTFDLHSKRTFGRTARYSKTPLHLFLFTDLLLITKKKG